MLKSSHLNVTTTIVNHIQENLLTPSSYDAERVCRDASAAMAAAQNFSIEYLERLMLYKHFISGWLTLFVIFLGTVANCVTICALLHTYMRQSSTNSYLLSLSISNVVSLICLLLMVGLRFTLVHPYSSVYCIHWYERFINIMMPYLSPINNMFQICGIYLTVAVSIDRYVLITQKVKESINRATRHKITWCVISAIFGFSFLYTLPNWFIYESKSMRIPIYNNGSSFGQYGTKYLNNTNQTNLIKNYLAYNSPSIEYIRTVKTKFGEHPITRILLHAYLYIPIVFAVPVFVLLAINFLIIYKLIGITARKRQLGTLTSIDRSITIMLVMIILVFLICQIPLMIIHILTTIKPGVTLTAEFLVLNSIANFFLCINLSINFALYCFFGEAFRNTIQYMFCIRKELPHHHIHGSIFVATSSHFPSFRDRENSIFSNLFGRRYSSVNYRRKSFPTQKRPKFLSVDITSASNDKKIIVINNNNDDDVQAQFINTNSSNISNNTNQTPNSSNNDTTTIINHQPQKLDSKEQIIKLDTTRESIKIMLNGKTYPKSRFERKSSLHVNLIK